MAATEVEKSPFCRECDRYMPLDRDAELCDRCAALGLHENKERVLMARAYWKFAKGKTR